MTDEEKRIERARLVGELTKVTVQHVWAKERLRRAKDEAAILASEQNHLIRDLEALDDTGSDA